MPAWSSNVGDAHYDDPAQREIAAAEALALGRTLHRRTQKFEQPDILN